MARVWVNGTFDVLHRGHLELLSYASTFGAVRVGIDSDKRVKQFKGDSRPINTLKDRIFMMESLFHGCDGWKSNGQSSRRES
jgi:cytidyltransferase-like protein